MEASPENQVEVARLIVEVLRCVDHPLTKRLRRCQARTHGKLHPLVHGKHPVLDLIKV